MTKSNFKFLVKYNTRNTPFLKGEESFSYDDQYVYGDFFGGETSIDKIPCSRIIGLGKKGSLGCKDAKFYLFFDLDLLFEFPFINSSILKCYESLDQIFDGENNNFENWVGLALLILDLANYYIVFLILRRSLDH